MKLQQDQIRPTLPFVKRGHTVLAVAAMTAMAAMVTVLALPTAAQAQTSPNRPIKMVVPFTTGGSTDISSRLLAQEMTPLIGQPVIVDNKPGNAGGIGIDFVTKAEPDGYTIGISGVGPTILLNLTGQQTSYNTLRDLAFVSKMAVNELVLVARKDFPANNVRELIAYAKANPGKVSFGNSGTNGPAHLANELFRSMAAIDGIEVPYKGDSPIVQDLMGSQLDLGNVSVSGSTSAIKAGSIKAIAMLGPKRSAVFPNVATADESGLPGYDANVFQIVVVPVKTPAPIVARLNEVVNKALGNETLKTKYADLGMVPTSGTVKDATDFVQRETDKWKKVLDMIADKAKK